MDIATFTAHRRTLSAPAGHIAYTEFGPAAPASGSAPAAVFVHGIATNGTLWRHVIEQLSDTTRCIAVDLPAHGATPPREDVSASALAEVITELCDGLAVSQADLVGNDTGGAVAQIFAARHPQRLTSLALTNCDTDGNFPPAQFAPTVEDARQGGLAEQLLGLAAGGPDVWRTSPLAEGYTDPAGIPDESWRAYFEPTTIERARALERVIAAINPADLAAATGGLRSLQVPTLLVWGTGDPMFGIKWAHQLRELIPAARDIIEIDGARFLFPEERPADLVPHLRALWGR